MVKIRMIVSIAGSDFALSPGDVTDRFDAEEASRLIAAGYATPVAEPMLERAVKPQPAERRNGAPNKIRD